MDFSGANFTSIGETAAPGYTGGGLGQVLVFDHPLTRKNEPRSKPT